MKNLRFIMIGVIGVSLLFSNFPSAESTLWDLLIDVKLEQNPLQVGDTPVVTGSIIDHAGKPVSDAEAKIRLGQDSIIVTTDASGNFFVEFIEFDGIPGNYVVNVLATTSDDKIGLASTDFQVNGKLSVSSYTEKILSTDEALKYLHASVEDFESDPLGLTLYNYYQDLQAQLLEEQIFQMELDEQQQLIEKQREISINITQQIIQDENPGAGTYSGWKYDRFVDNLDLSVKDIIINQLNYTVTMFDEAQKAMQEVLENGGTMYEARLAYYEKASIPREMMDTLTIINENQDDAISGNFSDTGGKPITGLNPNATENRINKVNSGFILNVNGTNIDVGKTGTVIYLSINGTIVQLIVNGTEISQANNSTQN